jgi:hypothetical protein
MPRHTHTHTPTHTSIFIDIDNSGQNEHEHLLVEFCIQEALLVLKQIEFQLNYSCVVTLHKNLYTLLDIFK